MAPTDVLVAMATFKCPWLPVPGGCAWLPPARAGRRGCPRRCGRVRAGGEVPYRAIPLTSTFGGTSSDELSTRPPAPWPTCSAGSPRVATRWRSPTRPAPRRIRNEPLPDDGIADADPVIGCRRCRTVGGRLPAAAGASAGLRPRWVDALAAAHALHAAERDAACRPARRSPSLRWVAVPARASSSAHAHSRLIRRRRRTVGRWAG